MEEIYVKLVIHFWHIWLSSIYYILFIPLLLQNSFSDIARVLSEFFRDLDVVPGDVVVGLVLLRQRQQLLRLHVVHQVSLYRR